MGRGAAEGRTADGLVLVSMQTTVRLLLIASAVLPSPLGEASEQRLPNILLIVADDLGYGELGCYGQQWIRTPRVDALAEEGIRLTSFYAGAPVCAPSRCVLMTGKHSGHAYIRDNKPTNLKRKGFRELRQKYQWEFRGQQPIPDEEVTIAELLQEQGYATAAIGKWGLGHFGTTGAPNRQGFGLFYGFNCQRHAHNHYPKFLWRNAEKIMLPGNNRSLSGETYSQDEFIREAADFIRGNGDRPFFLYLPLAIPHLSIQVPQETLDSYDGKIPEADYKHRGYLQHPRPRAGYAAMVTHMDRGIGELVDLIDDLGLTKNTLIVFTSDNGPTFDRLGGSDSDFFNSTAGLRGRKGSVYEGGLRVPLIARWPGMIAPETESDLPSAFWDLFASFCDLIDLAPTSETDGLSLIPEFTGRGVQEQHKFLYWEFPGYGGQQAVRLGRWKGVRRNIRKGNKLIELYDLDQDPRETVDLAKANPETVEEIAKLMKSERIESQLFQLPL